MDKGEFKDDLLDGGEAIADFLGLPIQTTYRMIAKGEIPTFKIGKKILGRRSEIAARFSSAAFRSTANA